MKTKSLTHIRIITVLTFLVTSALGFAGHYAFDFFGRIPAIAWLFPVNESTWEHLKLLFFPFFLCSFTGLIWLYIKSDSQSSVRQKKQLISSYLDGSALGVIGGMTAIVVLFYTINGLLGFNLDWLNIVIYFVGVAYACIILYRHATKTYDKSIPVILPILLYIVITGMFIIFTYYPPHIGLFKDPLNSLYGLQTK
jgi:hypothetical protein